MTAPTIDAIFAECEIADCWLFTGKTNSAGYGSKRSGGRSTLVHRAVWEALVGPIPEGMQIDHLCEQSVCVNPDHLRVVTPKENFNASKRTIAASRARRAHCKRGHSLSGDNLYIDKGIGARVCRECRRLNHRERMKRSS